MGTLSFSHAEIKLLTPSYALVVGKWLLVTPDEGNIAGILTLLYEKTSHGWTIILDDS